MSNLDLELEYNKFDWNSYVSYYEDLKNYNIDTKKKAWSHWKNHGKNEERLYFVLNEQTSKTTTTNNKETEILAKNYSTVVPIDENFDWVKYTTYYQDLKDGQVDTKEKAWTHWIKYGEKEGRTYFNINDTTTEINNNAEYINFDWEMYSQFYSDLQHKKDKQVTWEHWNKYGKSENRIYFDLNNSLYYKNFEWKNYVNNYDDLKHIITKEDALKHWLIFGINEKRTFLQKNTSKTLKCNFEDLFLINLTCHYLCIKNNIKFEYKCIELFKKFGIEFYIGKNTYKSDFILTNDNFFGLLNNGDDVIDKNIVLSKEIDCVTKEYCLFLKKIFYENSENQNNYSMFDKNKDVEKSLDKN
jgi:hypothetical protein